MPTTIDSNLRNATYLLGASVILLMLVVLGAWWVVGKLQAHQDEVSRHRDVRMSASRLLTDAIDVETSQRGYLLTGRESYLKRYREAGPIIDQELSELRRAAKLVGTPDAQLDDIADALNEKKKEMQATIELRDKSSMAEALEIVNSDKGQQLMGKVRAGLEALVRKAEVSVGTGLGEVEFSVRRLAWLIGLAGVVIFGAAWLGYYLVSASINRLVDAEREIRALNTDLEERVTERTTELTRANDEIQRFAYIVSHDLRAPLVNIMGFTSEMEAGAQSLREYFSISEHGEERRQAAREVAEQDLPEALGFIKSSTDKMDRLIGAILQLSREGRRELSRERVDLNALLEASVANLAHQIERAGASVSVDGPLPSVVADRLALEQVFGNLLDNAIKYSAPGRANEIKISAAERGGRVKVTIADKGRGIEPKDQERIFELFRRAGQQDQRGEGIGLAHVRALVRRLGGDVTLTSAFGEGSVFEVDLPKKMRIEHWQAQNT